MFVPEVKLHTRCDGGLNSLGDDELASGALASSEPEHLGASRSDF